MNPEIARILREQEELYRDMKQMREAAASEKRKFSAEEEEKWEELNTRYADLEEEMTIERKLEERKNKLSEFDDDDAERPEVEGRARTPETIRGTNEYGTRFAEYLRSGPQNMDPGELRALQMDADVSGGFLVASEQFINKLIQEVDDQVWLRTLATKIPCPNSHSLGIPTLETDASAASWTTEVASPTADSTMAFGKRELHPKPLVKLIKVSEKLLRTSMLDVEGLIKARMANKFAAAQENAFMTGTGDGQPLGIFVASSNGVSTDRDAGASNNDATALTAEGLIDALYNLKPQYLKNSTWLFHRDGMKQIRKLKDSTSGQFIWQPGLASDKQPSILDRPYIISEYCPNTFTASEYVGMIADFSYYWIADALDMRIQRLVELYAATNQVGFIGRLETDAQPVLEEAFSRCKLGS